MQLPRFSIVLQTTCSFFDGSAVDMGGARPDRDANELVLPWWTSSETCFFPFQHVETFSTQTINFICTVL